MADTFQLAAALPSGSREALQADCIAYAESVIEDEWENMDDPDAFKMDLENFKHYMANPESLRWHKIEDMKSKSGRNH